MALVKLQPGTINLLQGDTSKWIEHKYEGSSLVNQQIQRQREVYQLS